MNTNLAIEKLIDNCFYDPNSNYFMGIDAYGGDNPIAICVMKKNGNGIEVCYMGKTRDKLAYENEVKMLAAFYNIPDSQILKEIP